MMSFLPWLAVKHVLALQVVAARQDREEMVFVLVLHMGRDKIRRLRGLWVVLVVLVLLVEEEQVLTHNIMKSCA